MRNEPPKIDWKEISENLLWAEDWWNGIISGVAELGGRKVYFNIIAEDEIGNRTFAVYDLPREIWRLIDERHDNFVKHVGTSSEFIKDSFGKSTRSTQVLRPYSEHAKFYEKWRARKIDFNEKWRIGIAKQNDEEK